jgi:tetratricopeptide (TPR) repeat protein
MATDLMSPSDVGSGFGGNMNAHHNSNNDLNSSYQNTPESAIGLPSEAELVLLTLDYLRDLRRQYPSHLLLQTEGVDADYLTMACWALNRSLTAPAQLLAANGNDAYFMQSDNDKAAANNSNKQHSNKKDFDKHKHKSFPSLVAMEQEILSDESTQQNGNNAAGEKKETADKDTTQQELDEYDCYEYDDGHASNSHRFYPLSGLASGPSLTSALQLGEIAAAGLSGLGARSRLAAERDIIQSPLFDQFVQAVQQKGFFDDPDNDIVLSDTAKDKARLERQTAVYEDRFRKVVAKFRTKLATKADVDVSGDLLAMSAADQQRKRRAYRIQAGLNGTLGNDNDNDDGDGYTDIAGSTVSTNVESAAGSYFGRVNRASKLLFGGHHNGGGGGGGGGESDKDSSISVGNPVDLDEAERLKNVGNTHMQNKEYQPATDLYTQALKLSPAGPNSHVYFSNRAAALVSMKQFHDAILDSERSLALKPDYGKAHARLGLAHFLLGNYRQAMEAYTVSLKYEPDNKSSKNYLEKAAKRLAELGESIPGNAQTSYSVVSEWDRSSRHMSSEDRQKVVDQREAEKSKVQGNSAMASRAYAQALEAYSQAIKLSPNGPQSHVYYSNRAASLCYLERYQDAEKDSLKSLELNPSYGKAHARLGLSRFFSHDYAGAVEAYTAALQFDQDNSASKSYLAKAMAKLDETEKDAATRHMMEDPDMRNLAAKALASSPTTNRRLADPEMQDYGKAMSNHPSVMAAAMRK